MPRMGPSELPNLIDTLPNGAAGGRTLVGCCGIKVIAPSSSGLPVNRHSSRHGRPLWSRVAAAGKCQQAEAEEPANVENRPQEMRGIKWPGL